MAALMHGIVRLLTWLSGLGKIGGAGQGEITALSLRGKSEEGRSFEATQEAQPLSFLEAAAS